MMHTSASIEWLETMVDTRHRRFGEDSEIRLEQERQPSESDLLHVDCLAHLETYAEQLCRLVRLPYVQVHTHAHNTHALARSHTKCAHTPNAH